MSESPQSMPIVHQKCGKNWMKSLRHCSRFSVHRFERDLIVYGRYRLQLICESRYPQSTEWIERAQIILQYVRNLIAKYEKLVTAATVQVEFQNLIFDLFI